MFFSSNSNSRERLTCDMIFNVENQWIAGLPLLDQSNGNYEHIFEFILQKEKCQKCCGYLSYCGIEKSLTTRYEILIIKCPKSDNFKINSFWFEISSTTYFLISPNIPMPFALPLALLIIALVIALDYR